MIKVKTGDIVLFSGKSFISRLIRIATKSKFSHIGIIWIYDGVTYVFHSTSLRKPKGVKIEVFNEVLDTYDGDIYIRPIRCIIDSINLSAMKFFVLDSIGIKYESSYVELILAALGRKLNLTIKNPTSSLYCSELIYKLFVHLGYMEKTSSQYVPSDFTKGRDKILKLKCISYKKEKKITK